MTPNFELPLSSFNGERPLAPAWYQAVRAAPLELLSVDVKGAAIEVLVWGERGRPGLLLVHGARAHAHWWVAVAPLLARGYRVASMSLSGMGGSGWRDAYTTDLEIEELFAAAQAAGLFDSSVRPIFIAHSFGAKAASLAAEARGDELSGTILIDTSVAPTELEFPTINPPRAWPDLPTILSRFRLAPPESCDHPYILHDVARAGVVQQGNGQWRWRFDPAFWEKVTYDSSWRAIGAPCCPLAFVYGEASLIVTPERLAHQMRQAPAGTLFVGVPDAAHHIMLEQPIALATAIRAIVAGWHNTAVAPIGTTNEGEGMNGL
ncbi:MAG: alpha/beta hydrolase [Sphingomicrobium sp.]